MDEKPKSYFLVHFEDIGSTIITHMDFAGITPLQMTSLATWLEVKGKNELIQQENRRLEDEAEKNISRPTQEILRPK